MIIIYINIAISKTDMIFFEIEIAYVSNPPIHVRFT
jgi:hypothetical protein